MQTHSTPPLGPRVSDQPDLARQPVWPHLDLPEGHLDLTTCGRSPIKVDRLRAYLADYTDQVAASELLQGFSTGFHLHYDGPRIETECKNLLSVRSNEYEALCLVLDEVQKGRIAGPFDVRPLPFLRLNPIGLVPKRDGSFRLIQHLSFPKGESVNDFIDQRLCSVNYSSFDHAVDMISSLGQGALLGKMDIKSAFRLLKLNPSEFQLLGFRLLDKFYVDKVLSLGCAISCQLFESFSTVLEWIVRSKSKRDSVDHYLDDFLFAGARYSSDCSMLMRIFAEVCDDLGVPLAADKTVGPTHILIYLGLEINTLEMCVKIPSEKLQALKEMLLCFLNKKKMTLKELQSLVGSLNFCSRAIPCASAFNRRFYDATVGLTNPRHHLRISASMKEDMSMWVMFLDCFNGAVYFPESQWLESEQLQLFTDSAGGSDLGCAAILGSRWCFLAWPAVWRNTDILRDITFLELVPIALAFHLWAELLQNKKILLRTDNKALVFILNKKSSKSKRIMQLLRPSVLQAMLHNIHFKARHVDGILNRLADSVSRQKWSQFRQLAPWADESPVQVPDAFLRLISSVKLTDC